MRLAHGTIQIAEVVTIEAMTSEPPGPTIPCRPQSVDVGAAPYYCIAAHAQAKDRRSSAGGFGPAMLRHRGRKSEDFRSVVLARHNEPWPHKQSAFSRQTHSYIEALQQLHPVPTGRRASASAVASAGVCLLRG